MIGEIKEVPITTQEKRAVLSLTFSQLRILYIAVRATSVNEYDGSVENPRDCYDLHDELGALVDVWLKER